MARHHPPNVPPMPMGGGQPRAGMVIAVAIMLLSLSLSIVALRLYVRFRIVRQFHKDDFFIVVATAFAIGTTIAIGFEAELGNSLGLQGFTVGALKSAVAFHLLYFCAVWAVKMSILSFCYNVFGQTIKTRVKLVVWGFMAIVTTHFVVAFATTLFACSPVSTLWNPMVFPRGCFYIPALQTAHAAVNASTDVLVLSLPIALLQRTQINSQRKKFVVGIFVLAAVAVFASFARIISSAILSVTFDRPDNWILLPIFTALELNIAIASASLPSLSPLIKSAVQRVTRYTGGRSLAPKASASESYYPTTKSNASIGASTVSLRDLKESGGIQIKREYLITSQEPQPPLPGPLKAARMEPRSAVAPARRMSLVEMLRQGPDDERKLLGGKGKANEILGM